MEARPVSRGNGSSWVNNDSVKVLREGGVMRRAKSKRRVVAFVMLSVHVCF